MTTPRAISARPTVYRGIPMRSRLEARFAAYLDGLGATWEYEPRAYGSRDGQYLPDFEVLSLDGRPTSAWFVEVKPTIRDVDAVDRAMERIGLVWASEPSATLWVVFGDSPTALVCANASSRWELVALDGWRAFGRSA